MKSLRLLLSSPRYLAPALLFFSLNVLFATWAIYIPRITRNLSLSEADLGFAVFFIALGTLCIVPFVPRIINTFSLGHVIATALVGFCIFFIGPFIADTYVALCAALFMVGLNSGLLDVSMNTLVSHLEKEDKVQFMSVSHAFFSLGGMLAAGLGSLVMPYFSSALNHVLIVVVIVFIVNLLFVKNYVSLDIEKKKEKSTFKFRYLKPLIGLSTIAFIVMAAEGAIADWSALYLERVVLASASLFGLGYAVFNATMAFGRLFGDSINLKYGSRAILIGGCFIAAIGFALVLTASFWPVIFGFGIVGLGLSVIVPELFRYCANLSTVSAVEGISIVSGSGFVGLLLGPVFLGFVADIFSLQSSFMALLALAVIAAIIALGANRK